MLKQVLKMKSAHNLDLCSFLVNIALSLTLHTSPSDYVTFNQINLFLLFNIGLLLEREKHQKVFTGVDFDNWKMLLKTF